MRRLALLAAAAGSVVSVLSLRNGHPSRRRYTPYQRAALAWTDPRMVKARRALRRAKRRAARRR